jgi:arylesterase/paraoxonase
MSQTTVTLRATSATTAAPQAASGLAFAGPASMVALPTTRCQAIDVSGPEDIVIDAEFGIAYVSSQARERGLGARQNTQAGAIYILSVNDPKSIRSVAVASGSFDPADFHPHGIDLVIEASGKARLFVINHAKDGPRVEVFDVHRSTGDLTHFRTIGPDAALTNPNDIAAVDLNEFYLSNSHGSENRTMVMLEEWMFMRAGSVAHCRFEDQGPAALKIVEKGFSFLSGIAVDRGADPKRVYVAPLWAEKIIIFERDPSGELIRTDREIPIPGGPDNLNFDAFGGIWIGAAPDMR